MSDVLVSITCITYNHEEYISDALESFLMQKTNFNYEILIHDDASTDKTAEIIRNYEKKYPHIIKPIYQTENQYSKGIRRISSTFNIPRARGKYIAFCEGDDYWTDPLKLQKQVDYMENNPDCGMCFHAAEKVNESGGKIGIIKPYNEDRIAATEDVILGGGGFIPTNSILCKRNLMESQLLPSFFLEAPVGDYPLQIYLSTQKYSYYINETMSAYRKGAKGSWSERHSGRRNIKNIVEHLERTISMLNNFNNYSNNKYYPAVNERIRSIELEILILKRELKQIKEGKFKSYYNSLNFSKKLKLHGRTLMPGIYEKLGQLKSLLNIDKR